MAVYDQSDSCIRICETDWFCCLRSFYSFLDCEVLVGVILNTEGDIHHTFTYLVMQSSRSHLFRHDVTVAIVFFGITRHISQIRIPNGSQYY